MSLGIIVFLVGLFGVPIAMLMYGHRVRRRGARAQRIFIGAFIGHCVAGVVATVWGMIPPDAWTSGETGRGFAGLWSLLAFPVAGAVVGAMSARGRAAASLVVAAALFAGANVAAVRQQGAALVGVIGHWTAVDDGGPAWKTDGEKWSGTTTRAAFEAVAKPFFPAITDTLMANVSSTGAFPLGVWSGTSNFTGGTIRVQFKMNGGASDQNAGIVFGLQPNGEYHYIRYNTKDGNVAVWRYRNGAREVVVHGTSHAKLPLDTWHDLVVQVNGTKVTGRVSDSVMVEHTLERATSGRVGVWVKRDAVTTFRNFRVSP